MMTSSGDREKDLAESKNSQWKIGNGEENVHIKTKQNKSKKQIPPQNILFLFSTHSVTLTTILDVLHVKETAETKEKKRRSKSINSIHLKNI